MIIKTLPVKYKAVQRNIGIEHAWHVLKKNSINSLVHLLEEFYVYPGSALVPGL